MSQISEFSSPASAALYVSAFGEDELELWRETRRVQAAFFTPVNTNSQLRRTNVKTRLGHARQQQLHVPHNINK